MTPEDLFYALSNTISGFSSKINDLTKQIAKLERKQEKLKNYIKGK